MEKDIRHTFTGVKKCILEIFLPHLFFGKSKSILFILGALNKMMVKKAGLGLKYTVTSTNQKYLSFLRANIELIGAIT